jgi:tRNA (cytidine56-2'-O)-methyltransferase
MPRPRRSRAPPRLEVLRIGHRAGRDPRLSTHLALTARAFGAAAMYLNPPDPALTTRLDGITRRWGGTFHVVGVRDWRPTVRAHAGRVVHLTMYGEPLEKVLPRLRRARELLLVVGGAKVPSELYQLADVNVAVGHQPHSEVAALAILMDRLRGTPGPGPWPGAEHVIVPQPRGKKVLAPGAPEPA